MNKTFWEKFEPIDLIAIMLILFTGTMLVFGIPDHTEAIMTALLGFYFGHKITVSANQTAKENAV